MKIKTFLALLLLVIVGCGCSKADKDTSPEAVIVRELPKMYFESNIEMGKHKVIQTQTELEALFPNMSLNTVEVLKDIDFSNQTLLIGREFCPNIADLRYQFIKTKAYDYVFTIEISGMATQPDFFLYGIVVEKLPNNANISFNIQKSN